MLEDTPGQEPTTTEPAATPADGPAEPPGDAPPASTASARKATARKSTAKKATTRKSTAKKKAAASENAAADEQPAATAADDGETEKPAERPAKKSASRRTTKKTAPPPPAADSSPEGTEGTGAASPSGAPDDAPLMAAAESAPPAAPLPVFQAPDPAQAAPTRARRRPKKAASPAPEQSEAPTPDAEPVADTAAADDTGSPDADPSAETAEGVEGGEGLTRRRRRRGGRRRRKPGDADAGDAAELADESADDDAAEATSAPEDKQDKDEESASSRRRRRRRRSSDDGGDSDDDPQNTVTRVRKGRSAEDQITSVTGSTRLEAKKQRRREGREAGRRRAPIVSEAEFLARRESVDRVMAIRQRDDLSQIAVLEDKVLVEHYVARESQTSLIGNVYLGRVQNVLPSMEAAFIDIGKGRNAVLYAGEVNWSALGHQEGQPRKIESVLSSGQSVLVQVTKDPAGHKGARLTSQVSLAGRFLVYVPDGTNSGISRKLPDTERNRLKTLLKEIVPEGAGVIVRTAAEGASEEELTRDVERLKARWEDIEKKAKGSAPQLLYGEPDLTLKVVRDLFTEDFSKLVVQGDDAWETVSNYVSHVAPDLQERLERYDDGPDLFAAYRIDEQIAKGLDRKVWLPSGGSLVIDRTEAMTVVDVNTGKFTGSGGNLEETVTKNNLEAAEEIVRQLRLRDIGGIIVIDFIDMVLESNRDLVLRRLVECLGRDRTRHQVAEVTSLGLVQMTRKRIGTGLLEAFSQPCTQCGGRGLLLTETPVEPRKGEEEPRRARRARGGRAKGSETGGDNGRPETPPKPLPSPKDIAAMARHADHADEPVEPPEESLEPLDAPAKSSDEPAGVTSVVGEDEASAAAGDEPAAAGREPVAQQPDPGPLPEPRDEPTAERTSGARPEPGPEEDSAGDGQPSPPPAEPASVPSTPTVVTRTRRRSARRPAGPPTTGGTAAGASPPEGVGAIGAPPVDGAVEPGTADAERAPAPVEHVPVKKRGARKR